MPIVNGQIRCSDCHEWKPLEAFVPAVRKNGCGQCIPCRTVRSRAWRQKDPRRWRAGVLKRYGLTPETFDALLAQQGGMCACCGKPNRSKRCKALFVDHDHLTGKVRGLICYHCNTALGHLGDNAEGVRRALAYLENAARRATSD